MIAGLLLVLLALLVLLGAGMPSVLALRRERRIRAVEIARIRELIKASEFGSAAPPGEP